MLKTLLVLFTAGVVGMAVVSLALAVAVPLLTLVLKVLLVLAVGYLVLRLVRPDLADDLRRRARNGV